MSALYYIAPRLTVLSQVNSFHSCHMAWADQEKDLVIAKIHFQDEGQELHWRTCPQCGGLDEKCQNCKGTGIRARVEVLPHPILGHTDKLEDKHAEVLGKHHGVQKGCTMKEFLHAVTRKDNPHSNPLLRMTVF